MVDHKHNAAASFPSIADCVDITGEVISVSASVLEVSDRLGALKMRGRVEVETSDGSGLLCEVVGLSEGRACVAPFGSLDGVRRGARVSFLRRRHGINPSQAFLGRVVNGLGEPIDDKGAIAPGRLFHPLNASPPPAPRRAMLGGAFDVGIKAINVFTAAHVGQRLGVFAASGVGKSSLLGMIARHSDCDVAVIALIGERGREVREFIENHLGPERLARSVIIVSTSDEPAMMRREAAFLAMTLSEYFRDTINGGDAHVLCLMDSLTRVALAQREIGLAAGEPPTTKGYPPSVFSLLPSLVERAGPSAERAAPGFISGVFSVLVEGDDHDEPIADAARSILDGHIVLDRKIADAGRFPAININRSLSRVTPSNGGDDDADNASVVSQARKLSALYEDMRELVRIGAYRPGADLEVDRAVAFHPRLDAYLAQNPDQGISINESFALLRETLEGDS